MSHFAKVKNGIVDKVIVAEIEFFDTFVDDSPGEWIQTSYSSSIKKNFAGIDYTYDATRDAFIAPQPYPSWTLDEATCQWAASVAMPDDDKMYTWNEDTTNWTEIT